MPELDDIYNGRILELAGTISHTRRLAHADATATEHSKLCGSVITVDLAMQGGRVSDFGQSVKACLLGQAAAAVMAREVIGSTPEELRHVGLTMRAMLKDNGHPPEGRWSDLAALEPVRHYRARHASTLLVFDAVERALDEIAARPVAASGTTR